MKHIRPASTGYRGPYLIIPSHPGLVPSRIVVVFRNYSYELDVGTMTPRNNSSHAPLIHRLHLLPMTCALTEQLASHIWRTSSSQSTMKTFGATLQIAIRIQVLGKSRDKRIG